MPKDLAKERSLKIIKDEIAVQTKRGAVYFPYDSDENILEEFYLKGADEKSQRKHVKINSINDAEEWT